MQGAWFPKQIGLSALCLNLTSILACQIFFYLFPVSIRILTDFVVGGGTLEKQFLCYGNRYAHSVGNRPFKSGTTVSIY
jgi:hypothetical protein